VAFGDEKIDLKCDVFHTIIWDLMLDASHNISKYIVYKFFDMARPENQTLRRQSNDTDNIQYYDGSEWKQDSCENVVNRIMYAFETELLELIQGSRKRSIYLRRDGDAYMQMYKLIVRIGMPFRFMRLAAIVDDCEIDNFNGCDDEDIALIMVDRQRSRAALASKISGTIHTHSAAI